MHFWLILSLLKLSFWLSIKDMLVTCYLVCINGTSAVSNVLTPKNSLIIGKAGYIITGFLQVQLFFLGGKLCVKENRDVIFNALLFIIIDSVFVQLLIVLIDKFSIAINMSQKVFPMKKSKKW